MAKFPHLTAFLISFFPIAANAGLGFLMVQAGSNFQMPLVFAGLLLLAVEGIAMYAVFAYIEVRFARWAFHSSMSAAAH